MAGWWRHVLLSRIHQRPYPCDFIILFKFLSFPEDTFLSDGNVWLSAASFPGSSQVLMLLCLGANAGLAQLVLKISSNARGGDFITAFAISMLFLQKNSILNFRNFQHFHQTCSAIWNFHFSIGPRGHKRNTDWQRRRRTSLTTQNITSIWIQVVSLAQETNRLPELKEQCCSTTADNTGIYLSCMNKRQLPVYAQQKN